MTTLLERQHATNAAACATAGDWAGAAAALEQLAATKHSDVVTHNLAVARWQLGLRSPEQFAALVGSVSGPPTDVHNAALLCNAAVAAYHARRLTEAQQHLERLLPHLATTPDHLAMRTCFLLLEVYLQLRKTDAATQLLQQIEQRFVGLLGRTHERETESDSGGEDEDDTTSAMMAPLSALAINGSNFSLILRLYKARTHAQMRSLRPARRDVKAALGTDRANTTALFLKAYTEYLRHNSKKSARILHSAVRHRKTGHQQAIMPLYLHNLGGLYMQTHRFAASTFFLQQQEIAASPAAFALGGLSWAPAWTPHIWHRYELACSFLCRSDVIEAARVLGDLPPDTVLTWLRWGECFLRASQSPYNNNNRLIHTAAAMQLVPEAHDRNETLLLRAGKACFEKAIALTTRDGTPESLRLALMSGLSFSSVHLGQYGDVLAMPQIPKGSLITLFGAIGMTAVGRLADGAKLLVDEIQVLEGNEPERGSRAREAWDLARVACRTNLALIRCMIGHLSPSPLQLLEPFLVEQKDQGPNKSSVALRVDPSSPMAPSVLAVALYILRLHGDLSAYLSAIQANGWLLLAPTQTAL